MLGQLSNSPGLTSDGLSAMRCHHEDVEMLDLQGEGDGRPVDSKRSVRSSEATLEQLGITGRTRSTSRALEWGKALPPTSRSVLSNATAIGQ